MQTERFLKQGIAAPAAKAGGPLFITGSHATTVGRIVGWNKGDMTGLELHVDRGDGKGFVFLAIDTVPEYTDTFELPAGQAGLWKYMAIYRQGDDRGGQWSDTVSIAVAGK